MLLFPAFCLLPPGSCPLSLESGFHLKRKLKNVQAYNANRSTTTAYMPPCPQKMKENNEQPGINKRSPPFSAFSAFLPALFLFVVAGRVPAKVLSTPTPPGRRRKGTTRDYQGATNCTANPLEMQKLPLFIYLTRLLFGREHSVFICSSERSPGLGHTWYLFSISTIFHPLCALLSFYPRWVSPFSELWPLVLAIRTKNGGAVVSSGYRHSCSAPAINDLK